MLKRLTLGFVFLFIFIQTPAFSAEKCVSSVYQNINFEWWKQFNDENLNEYILRALENNYSLKNAGLKVLRLREEKNIEVSGLFPSLSVGANYLGLKIPKTAIPFQGFRDNAFALPFIAHWEIDLFGKRKNKIEMAKEAIRGAEYEKKWAALSLASEVAGIYFNICNLNGQADIQRRIIKNKEERLYRVLNSFKAGTVGQADLNTAKKAVEAEKITLRGYLKQRESFILNLAYLLGESANEAERYNFSDIQAIEFKGKIPEFVNSDVTLKRPDVLQKEADLKKAGIDVRLARKEFLPNINVFGVLMFSTLTPNFGWEGAVANMMAGATETLFSGGKRVFNLREKKFGYKKALNNYLDADLAALREINDALYYLKADNDTYYANLRNFGLEEDNFIRVSNSFRSGVSGVYDVLDGENALLEEKSKVLNSKVQKFADLISLYKATGGLL